MKNEKEIDKESLKKEKNEDEMDQSLSPLEILQLICRYDLYSIFLDVFITYKAACTLPITSANAKQAFSIVKILKTKLRSTMSEERLKNRMMISCEKVTEVTEIQTGAAINRLSEGRLYLVL